MNIIRHEKYSLWKEYKCNKSNSSLSEKAIYRVYKATKNAGLPGTFKGGALPMSVPDILSTLIINKIEEISNEKDKKY